MPLIQVTMVQGRTVEQKHALIRSLTAAMHESTGTPTERIRVAIYEVTAEDWGIGGEPFSAVRGDPATPDPSPDRSTAPTGGTDS